MTNKARLLGAAALSLMVAACGTDPQERVTGGAAAGAATGAGVGALGGPVGALAGAAIGGGAGAVTAATTSPSEVNLGRPVWDNPETRIPGDGNSSRASMSGSTRQVQEALNQRGYNAGSVDGIMGPRTRSALREFQRANNLSATGRADSATMAALNVSGGSTQATRPARTNPNAAYMGGGAVGGTSGGQMSQTNADRSGVATDADPGTGGTGGSGGSSRMGGNSPNYGGSGTTNPMERSGTATGADPGAGGTGGSGGGAMTRPTRPGVPGMPNSSGTAAERSGVATDADPGTGGTGGSGGSTGSMPPR
ncbi:peptidoglycan-binding domain-containing protein [Falsiroseomonas tokyonensis]|uniref:Peptidoglycan-binding protein n=1 Tax=Falsiroseomonas tokyonensis TaxID=430521 RepID=A0ABV7C0G1_9PROT|nr:peptidoglycan-binding domain-containing protein [Falsiroseomonas tokyonensis]MBU8541369.1 peptidoglycan-binding protein [Falsiroseomonas tokyonensis]